MRHPRKARGLGLALVGLLVGMLFVTPATAHFTRNTRHLGVHAWEQVIRQRADARYVGLNQSFIRSFSCAGTAFTPYDSEMGYDSDSSLRYRTTDEGNGLFRCNVVLPHGARVLRVAFSVRDTSDTAQVSICDLWRTNEVTGIGTELLIADVPATGIEATPGNVQLVTTSINAPVINNNAFSYFLQCQLGDTTDATGIWGANIRYRVTGSGGGGGAAVATAPSGRSSGGEPAGR